MITDLRKIPSLALLLLLATFLFACTTQSDTVEEDKSIIKSPLSLTIYKSPTCGCCGNWVEHMESNGFQSRVEHPQDMTRIKEKFGVGDQLRSCHTTVTESGYVFEGHIPAKFVQEFLNNPPPGAIGLTVPGMPVGSPGMEVENKFSAYQILQMNRDGSTTVFAEVASATEQQMN